jgi:hypothetical protein
LGHWSHTVDADISRWGKKFVKLSLERRKLILAAPGFVERTFARSPVSTAITAPSSASSAYPTFRKTA